MNRTIIWSWDKLLGPFLFQYGRKVGFGLLLFTVATILVAFGKIQSSDWMWACGMCTALIGGGTVADKWLNRPQK